MIRTVTTIKGSQISRDDIVEQLKRVTTLATEANDGYAQGLQVEVTASYLPNGPVGQDKVSAKVTVIE